MDSSIHKDGSVHWVINGFYQDSFFTWGWGCGGVRNTVGRFFFPGELVGT